MGFAIVSVIRLTTTPGNTIVVSAARTRAAVRGESDAGATRSNAAVRPKKVEPSAGSPMLAQPEVEETFS